MTTTESKRLLRCDVIADLARYEPEAIVRYSEKLYAKRIAEAADDILESGRRIVMLTGPSATGKTTSAHKLADEIAGRDIKSAVLSLDDFFVGEGRYPKRADGSDDYECLEALDHDSIHSCLKALHETGECDAPIFDFMTQMPSGETQHIDCRDGVVIVEGLHAFNPKLSANLPADSVLKIYASLREEYKYANGKRALSTGDIRLARRIVRDWKFRGHDTDFTFAVWPNVCNAESKYIKKFKKNADILLDTSFSYEVCLWKAALEKMSAGQTAAQLAALRKKFDEFPPMESELVPEDSMLREFVGKEQE